jgi:hypothetical protein
MSEARTQERSRRRKAMPEPIGRRVSLGDLAAVVLYLALCAGVYAITSWSAPVAFGLFGVAILGAITLKYLYGVVLLAIVHLTWTRQGRRCLVVYSNSPEWEGRVQQAWLAGLNEIAIVLNWSERASWRSGVAVRVFREFCLSRHNFNPAVVVFRGLKQPEVFRFFEAFQQARAGRPEYLGDLEARMFEALAIVPPQSHDTARGPNVGRDELHRAIKRGDTVAVREYLEAGGSVLAGGDRGWTPLRLAALRGNSVLVRMFLDAGADPNEGWPDLDTPVVLAAMAGSLTAVKLLLARGARTDARGTSVPELLRHYGYGNETRILEVIQAAHDRDAQ